ncbi:hypothetical protein, partial [Hydrotalea sp.]|uniref:hypothetical protein n=1 Tax=Hydrotalea sp. TaxID=2881279 RepID=UPI003D0D0A1D
VIVIFRQADGALIFLSLFVSKQKVKKISLGNVNTLASANELLFRNTAASPTCSHQRNRLCVIGYNKKAIANDSYCGVRV